MYAFKRECDGMDIIVVEESDSRAPKSKRRALVDAMLDPMLLALDEYDWDMRIARTALAMGKAGGLRPDHYLYCKNKRYFQIRNIVWLPTASITCRKVLLNFDGSKTNQLRKMEQRVITCRCPSPCAVHYLWDVCKHRLHHTRQPILLKQNGQRFNYHDMITILDSLCYEFLLDRRFYTPYCLRVGAACEDWWAGATKHSIMSKYGWQSQSSCDRYLRETNVDLARFLPINVQVPSRKP